MAHKNKLNLITLSRQREPIIIKSVIDTRKVTDATPEKDTKIDILRAIPKKKDYATFDL